MCSTYLVNDNYMNTMRTYIGFTLALIAIVLFVEWLASLQAPDTQTTAERIVATCKDSGDHAACYEREVLVLYPELPVPELFEVIRRIRMDDPSYQFCHVLGHKLGERVVAEDPERWVDAIPLNPSDGMCSNGFIHGVVGGRFRAEVLDDVTIAALLPDFKRACEERIGWRPSDLDRALCYHGLGHLYVFITDANMEKALDVCEATSPPDLRRVCIEGVFMQIYQPMEPDDFLMIERMEVKPSTTTVRQYCARYERDEYEGACLHESWPYSREGILDGTGSEAFCSGQPTSEEERRCYQTISTLVGRTSLDDPHKALRACKKFPIAFQNECYAASAQALLEEDRTDAKNALAFCRLAPGSAAEACVKTLVDHAQFIFGSNETAYNDFCGLLEGPLKQQCSASRYTR